MAVTNTNWWVNLVISVCKWTTILPNLIPSVKKNIGYRIVSITNG